MYMLWDWVRGVGWLHYLCFYSLLANVEHEDVYDCADHAQSVNNQHHPRECANNVEHFLQTWAFLGDGEYVDEHVEDDPKDEQIGSEDFVFLFLFYF